MAAGVAIGQLAVQALTAAVQQLSQAVGTGIKIAADLESSRQGFITLLGSAQKADDVLARIKKDAASTPFELPGLIAANQMLTSVVHDGNRAEDMLLNVGKALSAMGKGQPELDRLIVNLQQIGSVGHASMLDIKQFAFAGIPIFEMLSEATGKTGEALSEMISSGGVTFDVLEKMFAKAGGAGGKFADAFKNQAGTFNQLMSNMHDSINIFLSDLVKESGLFDFLKKAMSGFGDFMTTHKEQLFAFGRAVGGFFTAIGNTLIAAFNFLRPALEQLWNVLSTQLGPAFEKLWIAIQPLLPYIGAALIGAIYTLVVALTVVATVLSAVVNTVADFVNFIINLPTSLQNTAQSAVNWFKWLGDNWTSILGYVIGFIASIPAKVLMILVDMNVKAFNYLKSINWGQVADWFVDYWKSIPGRIYNIMIEVTKMIRNINWGDLAMGIGKGFVNSINGFIEGAINGALSGLPGSPKIKLPRFAKGVQNFSGGLAIVGEQGPEVVSLPRGSDVIPNNQLATSSSNNTTININVGLMTGSAVERRDAAAKMFEDLKDIASSRGMSVGQMINAS